MATVVSSNVGTAAWTSGTYYISASFVNTGTITVSAGVVIKFGSGVNITLNGRGTLWTINGTIANPVYMTSWNESKNQ